MAKVRKQKSGQNVEEKKEEFRLPLKRENYLIILVGVILIVTGYILMGLPKDPDAFLTRTLAPLILVVAYAIVIPIGIFYRKK